MAKRPTMTRRELLAPFRERVELILTGRGFDLLDALVRQAQGEDVLMFRGVEPEVRASLMSAARKLLVDYTYPRLKAIEVTQTEPVRIEVVDLTGRARAPTVAMEPPDEDMLS